MPGADSVISGWPSADDTGSRVGEALEVERRFDGVIEPAVPAAGVDEHHPAGFGEGFDRSRFCVSQFVTLRAGQHGDVDLPRLQILDRDVFNREAVAGLIGEPAPESRPGGGARGSQFMPA